MRRLRPSCDRGDTGGLTSVHRRVELTPSVRAVRADRLRCACARGVIGGGTQPDAFRRNLAPGASALLSASAWALPRRRRDISADQPQLGAPTGALAQARDRRPSRCVPVITPSWHAYSSRVTAQLPRPKRFAARALPYCARPRSAWTWVGWRRSARGGSCAEARRRPGIGSPRRRSSPARAACCHCGSTGRQRPVVGLLTRTRADRPRRRYASIGLPQNHPLARAARSPTASVARCHASLLLSLELPTERDAGGGVARLPRGDRLPRRQGANRRRCRDPRGDGPAKRPLPRTTASGQSTAGGRAPRWQPGACMSSPHSYARPDEGRKPPCAAGPDRGAAAPVRRRVQARFRR